MLSHLQYSVHWNFTCILVVSSPKWFCYYSKPPQFLLSPVSVCVFQVEWIQQQVVKRRIKRDFKQAPLLSLSSPAHSSPAQNNIFYNDAKWNSMWYIVSPVYTYSRLPLCLHQTEEYNKGCSPWTQCMQHASSLLGGLHAVLCPHLSSLWVKGQVRSWHCPDYCSWAEGFVCVCAHVSLFVSYKNEELM